VTVILLLRHPRAGGDPYMKPGYTYILASKPHGTLYIGVTSDIIKRVYQHKHNSVPGFTKKYSVHDLVYVETHDDMNAALLREKQLKKWNRAWKINLIERNNPSWNDLYDMLL
jgi:putative endonuclease